MGRNKRGSGADAIYDGHLHNTQYANSFSRRTPEARRQDAIEAMYHRILTELASNRFKWDGLPSSVDVRFMELSLFFNGLSVFFLDKDYNKFFALKGGGNGPMNMIENPTSFIVTGNQYMSKTISAVRDSFKHGIAVPIWANYLRRPDLDIVMIYAHKLARIDMTIEINSDNARRSKVLVADEATKLSVENANQQNMEGSTIRVRTGNMQDINSLITALDMGVDPDSLTSLHILRTRLWNECMGLLGIENANQDKKERLVASEVEANNDQTSMTRYVNLNARRESIERIRRAYPGIITLSAVEKIDFSELSVRYYTDEERSSMMNTDVPEPEEVAERAEAPEQRSIEE